MRHIKINKNNEFRKTYKKGKSIVGSLIVIYYIRNGTKENRIGLTVSKKLGNAVKRNRSKRLILESYSILYEKIKKGYDIIFVARNKLKDVKMNSVLIEMEKLLKKESLILEGNLNEKDTN